MLIISEGKMLIDLLNEATIMDGPLHEGKLGFY